MSTASPLPLQPLPPSTLSPAEASALKQQVAHRLAEHRKRRGRGDMQPALPMQLPTPPRKSHVADSVAARFAKTVSYREFLQQEAEASVRQAEAAAEVARRNAEAIAAAQQQLLDDIQQWNAQEEPLSGPELVVAAPAVSETEALLFEEAVPTSKEAAVVAQPATVIAQPAAVAVPVNEAPAIEEPVAVSPAVRRSIAPVEQPVHFEMPTPPAEPSVAIPANLIEFPRQLVAARRARPRLAEGPLRDEADASPERAQLRIFEVEASSVSIEPAVENTLPEWHSIRLDANAEPQAAELSDAELTITLPVYVAPVSLRLMAGAVDGCCIFSAFLLAVLAAGYASPVLPTGIPAAAAAVGTLFAFGLLYQLLFFSLGDATPGMRYARIGLCTFSDENPTRKSMRRRIFALLLAGMPLGLGVIWAGLDSEGLGWHDRISRMYPRAY